MPSSATRFDDEMLERLYGAIYGHTPDNADREVGLWSLICAGTPDLCGCSTRRQHARGDCRTD
jgi:hypothetical protein